MQNKVQGHDNLDEMLVPAEFRLTCLHWVIKPTTKRNISADQYHFACLYFHYFGVLIVLHVL